jgi:hypothetical protein
MMITTKEIQKEIHDSTGLKTSARKGTGSMKGYIIIRPIFQNGAYPNMPFEFVKKMKVKLSEYDSDTKPLFCSTSEISIYKPIDDRIQYKKENKPKSIENMKLKTWGSKNSQMRLDKASSRYAKNAKKGNTVRYS